MNIETLKVSLLNYINHFTIYDYFAYAWLILLFFTLLVLAIMLSKKTPLFSVFLVLLSFTLLFVGPFALKSYLDNTLRKTEVSTKNVQKLHFTNTLIVQGEVKNLSKRELNLCSIDVKVIKLGKNSFQNFLNRLKPIRKKSITLKKRLDINSSIEFKVVFDNFNYTKEFNTSLSSKCY